MPIFDTYTVPDKPEAAGNYVVNIGRPYNTCLNSLPFAVNFSNLTNFTLGNDTLLCSPASITLTAKQPYIRVISGKMEVRLKRSRSIPL